MPEIIGLSKSIEDPGTGASTQFHALTAYLVMLRPPSCGVTMGSWVSQAAYEAGKQPLARITVKLAELPTGDVASMPSWVCERILAAAPNLLSGAEPVLAAAAAEEPAA